MNKNFKSRLKTRLGINLITVSFAIILYLILLNITKLIAVVASVVSMVEPFAMAIAIAFVLNLPMRFIEKKYLSKYELSGRAKRAIAITITFILLGLLIYGIIVFVYPEIRDSVETLISSIPSYIMKIEEISYELSEKYELPPILQQQLLELFDKLIALSSNLISYGIPFLLSFAVGIANVIINLFLACVMSIYMLASKERIILALKKVILAIFNTKISNEILRIATLTNETFSRFIGGQITEAFILAGLAAVGMMALKLDYAPLISVILGISSIVPIMGPILAAIPCTFILLMISPVKGIVFLLFTIVLQQFEGNVIYPRVVGKSIGISGLWIMFSMLLGSSLMGIPGILLGIPTFAVCYTLLKEWSEKRIEEKNIEFDGTDFRFKNEE